MTIYVDELLAWGKSATWRHNKSCHMTTDGDIEELHQFAAKIGLKRSWAQLYPEAPWKDHYDLTENKRRIAVQRGVTELTWREYVELVQRKREQLREKGSNGVHGSLNGDRTFRMMR